MLDVENLHFAYGKVPILQGVHGQIEEGKFVGVLGNNGAGKSTFITCLNKILVPKKGKVFIDEVEMLRRSPLERAKKIAYVAQKNEIHQMTVFDAVLLGRKPYIKWSVSKEDVDLTEEVLEQLGLSSFKLRSMDELSGGELQKVMVARALVQNPRLLLLDEPTSNLDPKNQYEMMALVRKITKERKIMSLVVIHDINLALRYCDEFLFLKDGAVFAHGDATMVTEKILHEVYGISSVMGEIEGKKFVVIQ